MMTQQKRCPSVSLPTEAAPTVAGPRLRPDRRTDRRALAFLPSFQVSFLTSFSPHKGRLLPTASHLAPEGLFSARPRLAGSKSSLRRSAMEDVGCAKVVGRSFKGVRSFVRTASERVREGEGKWEESGRSRNVRTRSPLGFSSTAASRPPI